MTTIRRRFGALIGCVLMLVPFSMAAYAQSGCAAVIRAGEWTTIAGPTFDDHLGPTEDPASVDLHAMTDFAIVPEAPEIMYATNGRSVEKTRDGGCHWDRIFGPDVVPTLDVPISSVNSTIRRIEVPAPAAAAGRVLLAIEEKAGPVSRVHVVQSGNGGDTWTATDDGLPLVSGPPLALRSAPSDPNTVYLSIIDTPGTGGEALYASPDGGQSWERRSAQSDGIAVSDLAVDPLMPSDLWQWGGGGLFHSVDGGRTRARIAQVAPGVRFVDVAHPVGEATRVMAYQPEGGVFSVTQNGGATWYPIGGPPGSGISIAHTAQDTLVSVHGGVFRFKPPEYWHDVSYASTDFDASGGQEAPDIQDLVGDLAGDPSFYGRTPHTIMKYNPASVVVSPFDINTTDIALAQSSITPKVSHVRVPAGETKEVDYRLNIPAVPTPLDVFFLMDTTASMEPSIAGLRNGIARIIQELAASKIDVRFGLGEYKDYPIPGYGDPQEGDFPYRLDQAITDDGNALRAALTTMQASGGGRDFPESQLTGLYQAATGEGEPGCVAPPPDPTGADPAQPCVPPGQDAGFRPDALRVIVHITDAGFHNETAHPSPDFDDVASALRSRGIFQVGLAVFGPTGSDEPREDLKHMAELTDTVAPAGGVDCTGDGKIDIAAGRPLVCDVADEESDGVLNLAPAIVATLKALVQEAPVQLVPASAKPVVEQVIPGTYPTVNVKEPNNLGFSIDYKCPQSLFGSTRTVKLVAQVSGSGVATATTRVICGRPVKKPLVPPQAVIPTVVGLAPVIQPAPAIAIAPAPPPPAYQATHASQNVYQMQAALMPEEQEQVQLAIASQRNDQAVQQEDYSFSAMRTKEPSPAPLYLGAAAMTFLFGAATLATRRKLERAEARTRRR